MKVLVTGHLGYIGVEAVPVLRALGHEVTGLDTGLYDDCDFDAPPDPTPTLSVDLRDVTPEHLRGFDAVVHLAALSNDPLGDLNKDLTYDINLHASVRLAKAAKAAGVKRLFASSCSLYGAGADGYLDENAAFNPVTAYGVSKVRVEQEVSKIADAAVRARVPAQRDAYGAAVLPARRHRRQQPRGSRHHVGGKVLLQSDGTPWRSARAHPRHHPRVRRVPHGARRGHPQPGLQRGPDEVGELGIRQVAELVAEVVLAWRSRSRRARRLTGSNYRATSRRSRTKLPGYAPTWTLRKGIEELYEAYKHHGMSKEEWAGPRYYRLRTVKRLQDEGRLDANLRR